ncbi:IL-6 subfamily cytokine M17 [Pholidichthys leucotaenia]
MSGHVKTVKSLLHLMESTTTLLVFLLLATVASTRTVDADKNQQCGGTTLQQTLKLGRLLQNLSMDLIRTYKSSQGEMSEPFCKVPVSNVPNPNISGLDPSERMASIYARLRAFLPHFRRVYEQQTDLQPPTSPLLSKLTAVSAHSGNLASLVKDLYQERFPNLPAPEPEGGPTALPPAQNVFQQKVYGCVVLKSYKEFLSNVCRELRTLKGSECHSRVRMLRVNALFHF